MHSPRSQGRLLKAYLPNISWEKLSREVTKTPVSDRQHKEEKYGLYNKERLQQFTDLGKDAPLIPRTINLSSRE